MTEKSRLCFVGPMLGKWPGNVTSQGEILGDLLSKCGYPVSYVSTNKNRYMRFLDIAWTLAFKNKAYDVICLQIYSGPSFVVEDMASWIAKKFGIKIVMHLHGGGMPAFALRHPFWFRRVMTRADVLVTPSAFLVRILRDFGFKANTIPNIIELDHYPCRLRASIEPKLFWMRSFHDIYNPEMAVRVLSIVKKQYPQASLTMAGPDKGALEKTKRLAASLGLSDSVRFVGYLNEEEKIREAENHDIYLNTNHVDNMPVSIIEMAAMGLPVISTRVGGIPDLITPSESGLIVPDDQPEAMAEEVIKLLKLPRLTERLSRNGRILMEKFSADAVIPEWEKIFADLQRKEK